MSYPLAPTLADDHATAPSRSPESLRTNGGPPQEAHLPASPYPGLRPFEYHEAEIFFGRGEQVADMLTRLEDHRFLAVVGASGCGKSSLVRAGLLPALEQGFLATGSSRWRFVVMRPGETPLRNLARELLRSLRPGLPADDTFPHRIAFVEAALRSGPMGLVQVVQDAALTPETNVLVLVDQFEELFRFRHHRPSPDRTTADDGLTAERDEATALVSLLLATAAQREEPIYVLVTMRSSFLGDCEAFLGLSEAVSQSQFLTPRMTRAQLKDAIERPPELFGASAEPSLVSRILNEVGSDPDSLPLVQHALLRTWVKAKTRCKPERGDAQGKIELNIKDYEAVGGFAAALSRHADEAYDALAKDPPNGKRYERAVEQLFRALCRQTNEGLIVRNPLRVSVAAEIAGASPSEVIRVAEVFHENDRNFIIWDSTDPRPDSESKLDVSHECLFRQWSRLQEWIKNEAVSAANFRHLLDHTQGGAGALAKSELATLLRWRDQEKPNAAWSARYSGAISPAESQRRFDECMNFLRKSQLRALLLRLVVAVLVFVLAGFWVAFKSAHEKAANEREGRKIAEAKRVVSQADVMATAGRWRQAKTGYRDASQKLKELDQPTLGAELGLWDVGRRIPPPIQSLTGHKEVVRSVTLSNDGTLVASGSPDGTVRIWDVKTARCEKQFNAGFPVHAIAFLPDGNRILLGGGEKDNTGELRLWDHTTDRTDFLESHRRGVLSVAVSIVGETALSGGWDGEVRRWDLAETRTGTRGAQGTRQNPIKPAKAFQHGPVKFVSACDTNEVYAVAVSPDGTLGASAGSLVQRNNDGELSDSGKYFVKLWNLKTGELLDAFAGHWFKVTGVAFSPDGRRIVSVGFDKAAIVWDVTKRRRLFSVTLDDMIRSVSCSPNGQWALLGAINGDLALWRIGKDQRLHRFAGHEGCINGVAFSADGRRAVSGGNDGVINVWDVRRADRDVSALRGDWVRCVTFSPGKEPIWALSAGARTLNLRDGRTGQFVRSFEERGDEERGDEERGDEERGDEERDDTVHVAAFSPDASLVGSGYADGSLKLWDRETGRKARTIKAHDATITSLAFSSDGTRILTGGGDKTMKLWGRDDEPIGSFAGHSDLVTGVTFGPDEQHAVSASRDGTLRLWDLDSGQAVQVLDQHRASVNAVAFSSDGQSMVSGSSDTFVILWKMEQGKAHLFRRFKHDAAVQCVAVHSVGGGPAQLLAGCWDGTIWCWSIENEQRPEQVFDAHQGPVVSVAFSADGQRILSGGRDDKVQLHTYDGDWHDWSSKTLGGHGPRVLRVACSPDGRLALTAAGRGMRLWDIETGLRLKSLRGHPQTIWALDVSPDGRRALSGSNDGTVRIWNLPHDSFEILRLQHGSAASPKTARCAVFARDGNIVLAGRGNKIHAWDVQAKPRPLVDPIPVGKEDRNEDIVGEGSYKDDIYRIAVRPNASEAFVATSGKIWRLNLSEFMGPPNDILLEQRSIAGIAGLALAPQENVLLVGTTKGSVSRWNFDDSKDPSHLEEGGASVLDVAVSPNGYLAASGGFDNTVKLWSMKTNELLRVFQGHEDTVWSVRFSPQGERLLSGSDDGTLRIWDYGRLQRYREIQEELQNARRDLQKDRHHAGALSLLGRWYAFRGVYDWAIDLLREARTRGATDVSAVELARCHWQRYWETGDGEHLKKAQQEFAEALRRREETDKTFELYIQLCTQALSLQD